MKHFNKLNAVLIALVMMLFCASAFAQENGLRTKVSGGWAGIDPNGNAVIKWTIELCVDAPDTVYLYSPYEGSNTGVQDQFSDEDTPWSDTKDGDNTNCFGARWSPYNGAQIPNNNRTPLLTEVAPDVGALHPPGGLMFTQPGCARLSWTSFSRDYDSSAGDQDHYIIVEASSTENPGSLGFNCSTEDGNGNQGCDANLAAAPNAACSNTVDCADVASFNYEQIPGLAFEFIRSEDDVVNGPHGASEYVYCDGEIEVVAAYTICHHGEADYIAGYDESSNDELGGAKARQTGAVDIVPDDICGAELHTNLIQVLSGIGTLDSITFENPGLNQWFVPNPAWDGNGNNNLLDPSVVIPYQNYYGPDGNMHTIMNNTNKTTDGGCSDFVPSCDTLYVHTWWTPSQSFVDNCPRSFSELPELRNFVPCNNYQDPTFNPAVANGDGDGPDLMAEESVRGRNPDPEDLDCGTPHDETCTAGPGEDCSGHNVSVCYDMSLNVTKETVSVLEDPNDPNFYLVVFEIIGENTGGVELHNVSLTDNFNECLGEATIVTPPAIDSTVNPGNDSCNTANAMNNAVYPPVNGAFDGDTDPNITDPGNLIGVINPGDSVRYTFEVRVAVDKVNPEGIENCVQMVADDPNGLISATDRDTATGILPTLDIALNKTVASPMGPVTPGTDVTFDINIENQGDLAVDTITVCDTIPGGYAPFDFAANPGWYATSDPQVVCYDYADADGTHFEGMEMATINIVLTTVFTNTPLNDWVNIAEVSRIIDTLGLDRAFQDTDSNGDSNFSNDAGGEVGSPSDDATGGDGTGNPGDTDPATDEDDSDPAVPDFVDLALIKRVDPSFMPPPPPLIGQDIPFLIRVYNQGNVTMEDVEVTDYIPAGYSFATGNPGNAGWTDNMDGTATYPNTGVNLMPNDSFDLIIYLTMEPAAGPGSRTNNAEISGATLVGGADASMLDVDGPYDNDPTNNPGGAVNTPSDDAIDGDGTGAPGDTDPATDGDSSDPAFLPVNSIGSTVWADNNNDGSIDLGEPPVQGVVVSLYLDADMDGVPDGPAIATDTTDAMGNYFFDGLTDGNYIVGIMPPMGLELSSTPTNTNDDQIDNDDNGDQPNGAGTEILSPSINLMAGTEPTGAAENGAGGDQDDPANDGTDANGDMTVDFGLIPGMALGSTVFEDTNNNAMQDAGENGIPGVEVFLFADVDGDGMYTPGTDTLVATDTTDANGDYYFDALSPGDYIVAVNPPVNQPQSSDEAADSDTPNDDTDGDDNGMQAMTGDTIYSGVVTLQPNTEPTGFDESSQGGDQDDTADANGNMTVDFGLVPLVSVGSTVWQDDNNDGLLNMGEMGVAGVPVAIYPDADMDGVPDGPAIAFDTTDANGDYFFDDLIPGDYVVGVMPPVTLPASSTPNFNMDDQVDDNDNGDQPGGAGTEIFSNSFNLASLMEPDNTVETGQGGMQDDMANAPDSSGDMTIDFGLIPTVSVGSTVFEDTNNNAVQDPSEMGVPGVEVFLYEDMDMDGVPDGPPIASTTTDANGDYLFDDLIPGSYIVGINPTPNLPLSSNDAIDEDDPNLDVDGNDNGTQANPGDTIFSGTVTLTPGAEPTGDETFQGGDQDDGPNDANGNMTVDFGLAPGLSIGSTVFADNDNDGIHEPGDGENGIPGVIVILEDDMGNPIDTTITDSNGDYIFENLPEGNYVVVIPMQAFAMDEGLEGYPNSSTPTSFADDQVDEDDNGDQPGGAGTEVRSPVINLTAGTEPTGAAESGSGGTQDDGGVDANGDMTIDFGFFPNMSVGSAVWADTDDSGTLDPGEMGVPGVPVTLLDPGPDGAIGGGDDIVIDMTVTDANGVYLFDSLPPGDYYVSIMPPDSLDLSSTPTDNIDNHQDNDDNGSQAMAGDSINSMVFSLIPGTEPTDEPGPGGMQDGVNDDEDDDGDMTIDFGLIPSVSIGSSVWQDLNNDGMQDGSEPPVVGQIVNLYADANGDGIPDGPPIATDTTDAMGNYFFDGLPEGMYIVGLTPPDSLSISSTPTTDMDDNGAVDDDDNGIQMNPGDEILSPTITLMANTEATGEPGSGGMQDASDDNNGDMTVDFGLVPPMSLGSTVFADLDNSGTQDPGEDGVAGVDVMLYADVDGDGMFTPGVDTLVASTVTDANGDYFFDDLIPGEYIVGIVPPNNLPLSSDGATETDPDDDVDGDDDGIQMNSGDPIYSQAITLAPNTEPTGGETGQGGDQDDGPNDDDGNMTLDFGLYPGMSIGSTIFADHDNDGIYEQGDGENGLTGVMVVLFDDMGNALDTTFTDSNGDYFFGGLPEGTYQVGIPADQFGVGQPLEGYPNSSAPTSTADDQVDNDDNGDQPGGAGTVVLSPLIDLMIGTEPTGAAEQGSGGLQDDVDDANGDMTVDFGFYPSMSVGSVVWLDDNNDGIYQEGTEMPIAGVDVELFGVGPDGVAGTPDDVSYGTQTTAADGTYFFDGLPPGDYFLEIANPPASSPLSSRPSNPNDDGMDNDDNGDQPGGAGTPITTGIFTLEPGTEPENEPGAGGMQDTADDQDDDGDMTQDFGLVPAVSIGSFVWADTDDSGTFDAGEMPIPGVIVELWDAGPDGAIGGGDDVFIGQDTTDAAGTYYFDGLFEGDYYIQIPTPPTGYSLSSTPMEGGDDQVEGDDNGAQPDGPGGVVTSVVINLDAGAEPVESGTFAGDDQDDALDANGDMTIDFGFTCFIELVCPDIPDTSYFHNDPGWCRAVVNIDQAPIITCEGAQDTIREFMLMGAGAYDGNTQLANDVWIEGHPSGLMFNVGTTKVSMRARIPSLDFISDTCMFWIVVSDKEPPMAICKDIQMIADANCMAVITPDSIDGGSTDNCDPDGLGIDTMLISIDGVNYTDMITLDMNDLDPSNTTVWLKVIDSSGNESVCTSDIEFLDFTNPTVICQDDITVSTEEDVCHGIVPSVLPVIDLQDNCFDIRHMEQIPEPGLIFGTNENDSIEVFIIVEDTDGNRDTCSLFVHLEDTEEPKWLNCPRPTINVKAMPGMCGAFVNFSLPVAQDNCNHPPTVTQTDQSGLTSGDMFPVGHTVLQWVAVDSSGNVSDTCTIKIVVNDEQQPELSCPEDITVGTDAGECASTVRNIGPVTEDNCPDNLVIQYSIDNADNPKPFEQTGFVDASGSVFSCGESVVTYRVQDEPLLLITEVTHELQATNGGTNPVPGFITAAGPTGDDYLEVTNFGPARVEMSCLTIERVTSLGVSDTVIVPLFHELGVGEVLTIHFGSGTDDPANQLYHAQNAADLAPSDRAIYILSFEGRVIDVVAVNGMSVGGNGTVATEVPADFAGNLANMTGFGGVVREYSWDTNDAQDFVLADLCLPTTIGSLNPNYTTMPDNGSTVGLQSLPATPVECTFTVTVEDTELPACGMETKHDYLAAGGAIADGIINQYFVTVPDNFTIGDVNVLSVNGTHADVGELTIKLMSPAGTEVVLVDNRCASTANFDVTFDSDTTTLVNAALCTPLGQGNTYGTESTVAEENLEAFTGENSAGTWVLKIADAAAGNSGNLVAWTLQLSEQEAYAQMDTTLDNDPGVCGALFEWTHPTIIDNCIMGNVLVEYTSADSIDVPVGGEVVPGSPAAETFTVGTTTVNYTVVDKAGNISTCSFDVTVLDIEPPVVTCPQDITVDLQGGECGAIVNFQPASATDNCSIDTVYHNPPSGSTFEPGVTEVTIYVEDPAGNIDSCKFNVIVNEYIPASNQLVCNDALQISLDETCSACITADMILEGDDYKCYDDYCITLTDFNGNVLPDSCIGLDQVGDSLMVMITDCRGTGNSCWSVIYIEDKLQPEFDCPPDTLVYCNQASDPNITGVPELRSCEISTTTDYTDNFIDGDFCGNPRAIIERTWTVTDESGNAGTCVQRITVARFDPNEVEFPADWDDTDRPSLSCVAWNNNPSLSDPSNTGMPTMNGTDIMSPNTLCPMTVEWEDDTFKICDGTYDILRTWEVYDPCQPVQFGVNPFYHIQRIRILDNTPPTISCPEDITLAADEFNCFAYFNVDLLPVQVTDQCSGDITTEVVQGLAGNVLPIGTHNFVIRATDGCGNYSECDINITVEDQTTPTAICESFRKVSIGTDGLATVFAESFDDGSFDNCSDQVWFKVLRMETGACDRVNGDDSTIPGYQEWFDDEVTFCCEDSDNDNLLVRFRVYDVDPGEGPISPNALAGHWNECMVRVELDDKLPPTIECPSDLTLDCDADIDMDALTNNDVDNPFGYAIATGNCDVEITVSVTEPADCSSSSRFWARTFRATSANGQVASCTQRLWIVDPSPFTICDTKSKCTPRSVACDQTGHTLADDVEWPCDLYFDDCGETGITPDDLKANTGRDINGLRISDNAEPEISGGQCAQITLDYRDQVLTIVDDACFKVLRTWIITDWCQFDAVTRDPNDPDRFLGYWEYIQVIKVKDSVAPVVNQEGDTDFCDDDTPNCQVDVALSVSATDCSPAEELDYSYAIDLDKDGTIDLTGNDSTFVGSVPAGTHSITWTVDDGCDNSSTLEYDFTARECKKPTPVCLNGIATVVMPSTGSVEVWASDLESGSSFDNCTAHEDLVFTIRRVGDNSTPQPAITLSCDDIANGVQDTIEVEVWVTDESGNSDNCVTYILLQDTPDADNPEGVCPDVDDAPLAGTITIEEGAAVTGHPVDLIGNDRIAFTDANGRYAFNGMSEAELDAVDFVSPSKNDDASNGINTLDLIAIQQHILGVRLLPSAYKMIAADADNNKSINVLDLLELQQIILGLRTEFSNNRSWRYVSADEEMDMDNPYTFEEPKDISDMTAEERLNVDFIAVKVGDVNGSVRTGFAASSITPRNSLNFTINERSVRFGDEIKVPVTSENFANVMGYQFSLNFNPRELQFVRIESGALTIESNNVATNRLAEGVVSTNWYDVEGHTYDAQTVLFTIVLRGESISSLEISSDITNAEAYTASGEVLGLNLVVLGRVADVFTLYQNEPNPFVDVTQIRFDLPEDAETTVTILDVKGQEIFMTKIDGRKGFNAVNITDKDVNGAVGVLYYKVETVDYTATKKMIRVE